MSAFLLANALLQQFAGVRFGFDGADGARRADELQTQLRTLVLWGSALYFLNFYMVRERSIGFV